MPPCPRQELTLDEYEALLEERKASLNKARTQRSVDISEFANLKALTKPEEEDDNPLGVRAQQTWADRIPAAPAQCAQ